MTYLKLSIEPIPASSRLASLAKLLPPAEWNRVRRAAYRAAGYRCQVCGRQGSLRCHEVWQYNEQIGYQFLRGFQVLCQDCHATKHILFVHDRRQRAKLLQHFITVNRLSELEAGEYLRSARHRQRRLNQTGWIVNFGDYNWHMPPLKTVQQRRAYLGHCSAGSAAKPRTALTKH
jgi:5-methylcytosine-specific restriction endonuclease McrA